MPWPKYKCDFILDSDEHGEFCAILLCGKGDYFVKIDVEDYEDISPFRWFPWWRAGTSHSEPPAYAIRNMATNGQKTRRKEKMHRRILGVNKNGVLVDHRDGDGLNNRRYNLRVATNAENQWNQQPRKTGTSKYKGVVWHIRDEVWVVKLRYNGKYIWIGSFAKEIVDGVDVGEYAAAKSYDIAARMYFGTFACLNFPEETMTIYKISEKDEKKAIKLIAKCKGETVGDTSEILFNKSVAELELMCKYLGCNISQLAGKVQKFSKELVSEVKDEKLSKAEETEAMFGEMKNVQNKQLCT